jgi:hypothetical protein
MLYGDPTAERFRSEVRDGMRIEWDVPIRMEDGVVLRADVFRPVKEGRYPIIMTHGPYAKGLAFQEGYPGMWKTLSAKYPDAVAGSSNKYQNWETVDPEKWVPEGYVCVRVDSRGAGRSPGYLDIFSPRETRDYYECIEWAGVQPWSNGRVGLLGISYYAANQWQVAALQPPHLAAICPWEGASDYYRELTHHGGILNNFIAVWYPVQVASVQYGVGERGARNPNTGEPVSGPDTVAKEELDGRRADSVGALVTHAFDDDYYRERSSQLEKITAPLLSAGNWSHALHTRGNFEGYTYASSGHKWLEVHGLEHFSEFYTDCGVRLQKRFFGHFLKGEDAGARTGDGALSDQAAALGVQMKLGPLGPDERPLLLRAHFEAAVDVADVEQGFWRVESRWSSCLPFEEHWRACKTVPRHFVSRLIETPGLARVERRRVAGAEARANTTEEPEPLLAARLGPASSGPTRELSQPPRKLGSPEALPRRLREQCERPRRAAHGHAAQPLRQTWLTRRFESSE